MKPFWLIKMDTGIWFYRLGKKIKLLELIFLMCILVVSIIIWHIPQMMREMK